MNVTLRRVGNSLGIIILKEILDRYGLKEGDTMSVAIGTEGFTLNAMEPEFARQIEIARKAMDKYRVALKKLAE